MHESVYKIIELIGVSAVSFEKAIENAVETASKSLRDIRIGEIKKMDVQISEGKVVAYRVKVSLSFKYEGHEEGSGFELPAETGEYQPKAFGT